MYFRLALTLVFAIVFGCDDGGISDGGEIVVRAGNTFVFESRQSQQCISDGITPAQSAQRLVSGGIDVVRTVCGVRDGVYAAVCGGETGEILVHEIRSVNVVDAEALGFADVATLAQVPFGPGTSPGYQLLHCSQRVPIGSTAP